MSLRLLFMFIALLGLAGCASTPQPGPVAGGGTCNAEPAQPWVGKPASDANVQAAFKASGAKTMRSLKPGQAVTMDYREDRVNIAQDASGTIERISCG
ncbi:MAG TPA: I78 family peptidase inhibitor [Thermomonas sp.]|nr:I78 family peptidase inhibitor [Thermomonas sp.]